MPTAICVVATTLVAVDTAVPHAGGGGGEAFAGEGGVLELMEGLGTAAEATPAAGGGLVEALMQTGVSGGLVE